MNDLCDDLAAEYGELAERCHALSVNDWTRATPFYRWTPRDEIAHLCYFEQCAAQALANPPAFRIDESALKKRLSTGEEISAIARAQYAHLDDSSLLTLWQRRCESVIASLRQRNSKDRIPWFGPDMSARSFATARLMETWAHGQDIWDALSERRPASDRIRHIAHLGVTTLAWSFSNRGMKPPAETPFVRLDAPSGAIWTWGDSATGSWVRGPAEDFCLVVTQRRHAADTALEIHGEPATTWLAIAQCFAGPPAQGPEPGRRNVNHVSRSHLER
ncbi:TIGR03084 family metal-binding protein [Variovorax sp. PBL-E5]|uniref:TIGR03084 family metal-binding protein n=1 Tax=Variovorax sp. PBL-E5 TaxID=434014 RepID=UPI001316382E|nr:TIGR03084 family metal-binding protein [Variovorax sp. PBL-E5]VTU23056.1 putative Actinobacterial protein [Variovorax sp. PBL-E5]